MAASALRRIAAAQEEFRARDLDGNGVKDYWRSDIAGLYLHGKDAVPLHDGIAAADERPATELAAAVRVPRGAYAGFWFRTIRFPGETALDRGRFAACCFPYGYAPGIRSHYVISQEGVVYRKDLGHGNGIDVYPADPLGEGWRKVD